MDSFFGKHFDFKYVPNTKSYFLSETEIYTNLLLKNAGVL